MKRFLVGLLVVALVPMLGCESKSSPGGPGATRSTDPGGTGTRAVSGHSDQTFKIGVPTLATDLKQGEKKELTISISRGDNFKQDVQLKFEPPKGVQVTPAKPTVKASEKEVKIHVEAMPDAPLGETTIPVTGTPETGVATSTAIKLDINKGGEPK